MQVTRPNDIQVRDSIFRMSHLKRVFQNFCESTSLHGYNYLFIATSVIGRIFFSIAIFCLSCIGVILICINYLKYSKSSLVTTIESTTAPLREATFPSITVCNFNQLEASYLKDIGVANDIDLKDLLVQRYVTGHKEPFTEYDEEIFAPIENHLLDLEYTPNYGGRQWCRDMFIHSKFENMSIPWSSLTLKDENDIGPFFYGTDYGSCCFLSAHHDLNFDSVGFHELNASAKHGESNGLSILFDIEQFNYGYVNGKGSGLKLALHHHLDKPMMQFSSQHIQSGTETQINLKPTITITSQDAIRGLRPNERNCFIEGENNLTTLSYEEGFRYEMNNCLIDEGILKIYWYCRCEPLLSINDPYMEYLPYCEGQQLHCANEITKTMGLFFADQHEIIKEVKVDDLFDNSSMIGNIIKPKEKLCLPGCKMQENNNIMSSAQFPPDEGFFAQPYFCYVASHILQATCAFESRRYFLSKKYPNLCNVLEDYALYFGEYSKINCKDWPRPFFDDGQTEENHTLTNEVSKYGKANLALVHIFFQSPYITKMKRDLEMTFTDFIAKTGGLMGLCLGFSCVSLFEILYWCCSFCTSKRRP